MIVRCLLLTALFLVSMVPASLSWAHGTRGVSETAAGIRVTAEYDDGEPMSYAAVQVNVAGEKLAFQKGRTDRNGVFMFAPDRSGHWRIVVSDEMGHRLVLERDVDAVPDKENRSPAKAGREATEAPLSRWEGAVAGLAIIFGLCGFLYGWQVNRRLPKKPLPKDV